MTDPISDMLTRIRNAYMAKHKSVTIPHSNLKEKITGILKDEGYIESFSLEGRSLKKTLHILLRYKGKLPAVDGIERISKPGRRIYARAGKIPNTLGGFGLTIISTSKGVMSDKKARKEKIGGEVLCRVW